jgi:hypothetical protein
MIEIEKPIGDYTYNGNTEDASQPVSTNNKLTYTSRSASKGK